MKKILKWGLIGFLGLIVLGVFGSGGRKYDVPRETTQAKVTKSELLSSNDPNLKRFIFATADHVGQSFTLYVMTQVTDYYNYGFADELKYYSFQIGDSSIDGFDRVYAYIDKTNPATKAQELFDLVLDEQVFLKINVSIPSEKYSRGSNSFLEIESWEQL